MTAEYELVVREESGRVRRFLVGAKKSLIGRCSEADIRLQGDMVSRRHAQVSVTDGVLVVEDLGSRNGVLVNAERMQKAELHDGDTFIIGGFVLAVTLIAPLPPDSSFIKPGAASVVYNTILQESGSQRLSVLYRAAELLSAVAHLEDLLGQLLGVIFDALPAEHGYIFTLDPASAEPKIRATRSRDEKGSRPPVSMTLVNHVMRQEDSVLTQDALSDTRFREAASVVAFTIHSAMCVPLRGRTGIEGAIYVDSCVKRDVFSNADLELLTAIGCVAGIAVENARLYQENIEKERLAAIGEATAGIGHCVKNILTGIKGGARFIDLAREQGDLKQLERGWPLMSRAVERMEALVLNMLAFSRELKPERRPCDINRIVKDALDTIRTRAEKHKITLEFEAGEVGLAATDETGVFRVVLNLLTNAVDACERQSGTIRVATRFDDAGYYVDVADTGPGIKPEFMPRLFEAFASTKGSSGIGLGLACSRKIMRELGGDIVVESEEGKGARFTLFLDKSFVDEQ